ncbi:MAG: PAS domain-containing sensor histidine kinase [Saprospiraceae bacterium]
MESRKTDELFLRYRAMVESAVDGIINIDRCGIIESVNPATCKLFGYSEQEMVGQTINMLMPSPYREHHDGYIQNYLSTGVKKIIGIGREVTGIRKNGTTFPFWLSVVEVIFEGMVSFTGFVHDITDLKNAESEVRRLNADLEKKVNERTEQLAEVVNQLLSSNKLLKNEIRERQAAEEALSKNRDELLRALDRERELSELKSRFVALASHEFRTPLSTILSSASLVKRYAEIGNAEKQDFHLEKIRMGVNHLTGILNDFLNLSKLEEGLVVSHPESFNLTDFAAEITDEMSGLAKPGQRILWTDRTDGREVSLDRRILKNVLYNLISNALKYSERDVQCRTGFNSGWLEIEVRDHGIGIPESDQKHMFDRFFRAKNALHIQGTGLGLNIVRRYLDLLGGDITFVSREGEGTTFSVRLPIAQI